MNFSISSELLEEVKSTESPDSRIDILHSVQQSNHSADSDIDLDINERINSTNIFTTNHTKNGYKKQNDTITQGHRTENSNHNELSQRHKNVSSSNNPDNAESTLSGFNETSVPDDYTVLGYTSSEEINAQAIESTQYSISMTILLGVPDEQHNSDGIVHSLDVSG